MLFSSIWLHRKIPKKKYRIIYNRHITRHFFSICPCCNKSNIFHLIFNLCEKVARLTGLKTVILCLLVVRGVRLRPLWLGFWLLVACGVRPRRAPIRHPALVCVRPGLRLWHLRNAVCLLTTHHHNPIFFLDNVLL